jgi:hypothetical protein
MMLTNKRKPSQRHCREQRGLEIDIRDKIHDLQGGEPHCCDRRKSKRDWIGTVQRHRIGSDVERKESRGKEEGLVEEMKKGLDETPGSTNPHVTLL